MYFAALVLLSLNSWQSRCWTAIIPFSCCQTHSHLRRFLEVPLSVFFVIYLLLPLYVFVRSNYFFLSIIQSFSWIRYHRLCVTPGCHSFSTSSAGSYLSPAASWETLSVECDVLSALLIIGSAHQPALSCTKPQAETLILSKICRKHFHVSQNTVLIIGCR